MSALQVAPEELVAEAIYRAAEGESQASIARSFGVSYSAVSRWVREGRGSDWIDPQPLLDYLDERGGLTEVFAKYMPTADDGEGFRQELQRSDEEKALAHRTSHRIADARRRKRIDYFQADELCCDVLRVHPSEVWGEAWFDLLPEAPERPYEVLLMEDRLDRFVRDDEMVVQCEVNGWKVVPRAEVARRPSKVLSLEIAREIRKDREAGESCRSIARRLGVDRKTIERIVNGRSYREEEAA